MKNKITAKYIGISHLFNLSALENQILKEKITGLYEAMENILFQKSKSAQSVYLLSIITDHAKKIQNILENTENNICDLTVTKDDLTTQVYELINSKKKAESEYEKLKLHLKEKNTKTKEFIEIITEEKEKLNNRLETSEYNYKVLNDDYEKLRKRIKQVKFLQPESDDDKICKNCKRFFKEEENFNWSCKIHTSQYSGEI